MLVEIDAYYRFSCFRRIVPKLEKLDLRLKSSASIRHEFFAVDETVINYY